MEYSHLQYTFYCQTTLSKSDFLVDCDVGHELPSDPALSLAGDLYETRSENWESVAPKKHRA